MTSWRRRSVLAAGAAALAACGQARPALTGGFNGAAVERGHLLREVRAAASPTVTRRTGVLIAGGGVAGLAAARALRLTGREDFVLLELEDECGGNSRGTALDGMACPMGAHYLPVPGDGAPDVQDLLQELGLRRRVAGRWQIDERHLCHSPQERLFIDGHWQDGLLPVLGISATTLAQYRRFAALVDEISRAAPFALPCAQTVAPALHLQLDALVFDDWLGRQGLDDPRLRWYLDYCCRDDFGAGSGLVSAWAGIHYFASRHGFSAPGDASADRDGLLTWPEGNAWLTRRLAAPLEQRRRVGQLVLSVQVDRAGVAVDVLNLSTQGLERWQARHCIVALPAFVAARVLHPVPVLVQQAAAQLQYAPWLVANLQLNAPLHDRPGAPPSWDNVLYGSPGLGYVDATHQKLTPVPGSTVLTCYRALSAEAGAPARARQALLERPWSFWRDLILQELAVPHPDLAAKAVRLEISRYGHAMAIPRVGTLAWLRPAPGRSAHSDRLSFDRIHLAHSDWAGYSVFEEAFTLGHRAGMRVARLL